MSEIEDEQDTTENKGKGGKQERGGEGGNGGL